MAKGQNQRNASNAANTTKRTTEEETGTAARENQARPLR